MRMKILLVLACFSSAALAGLTQPAEVQVDYEADGSGIAQGDMVTARFDENDEVFIGCGIRAFDFGAGNTFEFAFCQARDSNLDHVYCNTESRHLIDGFKSVGDYSFIIFRWNAAGECTEIGASTQSFYMPDFRDQGPGSPGRGRGGP